MTYIEKQKVRLEVELINSFKYFVDPVNYYDSGVRFIHIFKAEDNTEFVWKTSKNLSIKTHEDEYGEHFEGISIGGKLTIDGTIKANSTYKGNPQVVLTRCSVYDVKFFGYSDEELEEIRKEKQLTSLSIFDKVIQVSYKEYKENYSTCEKVVGSFIRTPDGSFIDIIIRG